MQNQSYSLTAKLRELVNPDRVFHLFSFAEDTFTIPEANDHVAFFDHLKSEILSVFTNLVSFSAHGHGNT